MSKYSKEDIIKIVKEEDVHFIRLQFTDIFGILKNVAITPSQLEKALSNDCMFDGSSIDGFARIHESDMYLYPDLDTFVIFPWRPQIGKVARLICDVYTPEGKPFAGDPRYALKRVLARAADMGYTFNVGPELEFFIFHFDEEGKPTTFAHDQGGYFDLEPVGQGEDIRREICLFPDVSGPAFTLRWTFLPRIRELFCPPGRRVFPAAPRRRCRRTTHRRTQSMLMVLVPPTRAQKVKTSHHRRR